MLRSWNAVFKSTSTEERMKKTFLLAACLAVLVFDGSSVLALSPSSFDAGLQLSHITYKEPGLMRESGIMYGVTGAYTRVRPGLMWRIDGTLTTGQVEYVGSYWDGTPLTVKGIQDTMFETRAVLGPTDFVNISSYYLPFIGIGYRYLYDGADKMAGGYRRESNYIYIPLGVDGLVTTKGRWSVGFTAEYDMFISGKQYSYLSDADPGYNDMENTQDSGYGYRASLKFMREGKQNLTIEPFVKYWKIDKSNTTTITYYGTPVGSGYEPSNNSTELGVRVLIRF
jgi:hypothetical protein